MVSYIKFLLMINLVKTILMVVDEVMVNNGHDQYCLREMATWWGLLTTTTTTTWRSIAQSMEIL